MHLYQGRFLRPKLFLLAKVCVKELRSKTSRILTHNGLIDYNRAYPDIQS
jgi:hypothetical protein